MCVAAGQQDIPAPQVPGRSACPLRFATGAGEVVREAKIITLSSHPRPQSSKLKIKRRDGFTNSGVNFARRSTPVCSLRQH